MTWNDFFWPLIVLSSQNPTVQVAVSALASGYVEDYSLVLTGTFVSILPLLVAVPRARPADHRRDHAGGGEGMTIRDRPARTRRARCASPTASSGARRPRRTRSRARRTRTAAACRSGTPSPARPGASRTARPATSPPTTTTAIREDVALMARRSGSPPTASRSPGRAIQPGGRGPANERGLDFYRRLVDALLEAGIEPLPDALPLGPAAGAAGRGRLAGARHRRTGSPSTPGIVFDALGDRVQPLDDAQRAVVRRVPRLRARAARARASTTAGRRSPPRTT